MRVCSNSGGFFDVPARREELNQIEARASAPDFWSDQVAAQKLLQDRSRLEKQIERQEYFESQVADAEVLAVQALSFIAADPERLGRFLAVSGIGPDQIRAAAREPHFLAGVLDHMAADERLLLAFAGQRGFDPGDIVRARQALGALPDGGSG